MNDILAKILRYRCNHLKQLNATNLILKFNLPSAALAVAHSPSGCAMRCIAVGAIPIGMDTSFPRTLVFIQRCETSTIIFGISRYLEMKGIRKIYMRGCVHFYIAKTTKVSDGQKLKSGLLCHFSYLVVNIYIHMMKLLFTIALKENSLLYTEVHHDITVHGHITK